MCTIHTISTLYVHIVHTCVHRTHMCAHHTFAHLHLHLHASYTHVKIEDHRSQIQASSNSQNRLVRWFVCPSVTKFQPHHTYAHASWTHLRGSHGLSARRSKSRRPERPQTRSWGPEGPLNFQVSILLDILDIVKIFSTDIAQAQICQHQCICEEKFLELLNACTGYCLYCWIYLIL